VQQAHPPERDAAHPAPRAGQRPRDRGDRVGVAASAHGALHDIHEPFAAGDGRPGGLQRLDDPTVAGEVARRAGLGVVEQGRPPRLAVRRQERQADPRVDNARAHGVPDREAPQHAGVPGILLEVGEAAERPGDVGECLLPAVVEVSEGDGGGAHERPVATRAAGDVVHAPRRVPRCCRGQG